MEINEVENMFETLLKLKGKENVKIEMKEDEHLENGIICCNECNTSRVWVSPTGKQFRAICECQSKALEEERIQNENNRLIAYYKKINEKFIGKRYKDVNFCNFDNKRDVSIINALNKSIEYCKGFNLTTSNGMYLYGGVGTGKTHLMICIANYLIENKLIKTLITNFIEISKNIRSVFNNKNKSEEEVILNYCNIPILIIDDIGTEKVKSGEEDNNWMQEKIYEILNYRYTNMLPTLFSSNYSLKELLEQRGLAQKTIDRIYEMTKDFQLKMEDLSYRLKK